MKELIVRKVTAAPNELIAEEPTTNAEMTLDSSPHVVYSKVQSGFLIIIYIFFKKVMWELSRKHVIPGPLFALISRLFE